MSAVVVVGAQWGDEGKGKIVDIFTEHAEVVVRYAGGPNAGHTLVVGDDKVIVRLVPSGILRPHTRCVLGQGMAIDPSSLIGEIDELQRRGYAADGQLVVSERAHAILPYHIVVDTLREQQADAIGTTKRGVGPCYEDKMARRGVPLGAFRDRARTEKLVRRSLEAWQPTVAALGGELPTLAKVMEGVDAVRERIVPLLVDASELLEDAIQAGKNVLFEGAQGTLLDIDHGTYPFVTSSNSTAGGAATGTGVGPTRLGKVIGLVKAYSTRVGGGPFPTELNDETGERLRKVGAEFGSVTGRPRRTGWLDACAVRYAARVNGLDGLALTKLDVLTGLPEIKVCTGYRIRGVARTSFPLEDIELAEPIYETLPGWGQDISAARTIADLPPAAQRYIEFVERETRCKVVLISVGQRRDETILLEKIFS
ncbi:adenylosuccinate synthase [Pendulispora rubella]|uniref:Adenylosuccinate synthetase n=1 Tax=Pendulispora rubella TaxID=2741070 RepID=A0ABZ2LIZ1_9BACT